MSRLVHALSFRAVLSVGSRIQLKTIALLFFIFLCTPVELFAQTSTSTVAPQMTTPKPQPPPVSAFQQWLQNNGYQQPLTPPSAPEGVPRTVVAVPAPPPRQPPTALTYDESQQVMVNSAPPSRIPKNPDSDEAFNLMMQSNMPLTPEQVVLLRQQIDTAQRAASIPANIPPKPVSTTLIVNLAPGTTPPAIRLALGYVSSLVFVDSSGSPWPIASYDIGNPKTTNIQWDGKSNILLMQATAPYSDGNMVVRLIGLPTPVTLQLVTGQRVVDYRVDIHVSGIGPNTKELPLGTRLPDSANQLLLQVLDGIAPYGSKPLMVKGCDCLAWQLGERMYLRTRLTLLSPGWIGKMSSPDGMQAYELQKASSILVSRYGEPVELKVEGF